MLNGSIPSAIILIHLNPSLTSMIYLLAVSPFESGFTGWGHHCYTDIPWYTDHPSLVHGTPTRSHTDQSIESLLPHEWFSHLHPHCESSNYGNPIEVIWTASWFIHVLSLSTVSIFLSHFPQFFHHFLSRKLLNFQRWPWYARWSSPVGPPPEPSCPAKLSGLRP